MSKNCLKLKSIFRIYSKSAKMLPVPERQNYMSGVKELIGFGYPECFFASLAPFIPILPLSEK
jgi:hypothetical protein